MKLSQRFLLSAFAAALCSAGVLRAQDLGYRIYPTAHRAAGCTTCEPAAPACDTACAPACGCEEGTCFLFGDGEAFMLNDPADNDHGIKIGGWTAVGYHNRATIAPTFFGPGTAGNVTLTQQNLYIERAIAPTECEWDFGFRADVMYGTDGADTQAFGGPAGSWDFVNGFDHGIYSWAIPQVYLEAGIDNFKVKVGRFYTPVGYEVVPSNGNFFFSHAFTMYNSEPFTHTGVLATYTYDENLEFYAGWSAGWDTGFDTLNDGSAYMSGVKVTLSEKASLTYMSLFGRLGSRTDGYNHSLVLTYNVTENLTYVGQSDLVLTEGIFVDGTGFIPGTLNDQVGINQYLFYKLSDCLSIGGRAEWWKTDGVSVYEATAGINYKPHANLVLRPEIRQDWCPSATGAAALGLSAQNQTIFGIDGVLTY